MHFKSDTLLAAYNQKLWRRPNEFGHFLSLNIHLLGEFCKNNSSIAYILLYLQVLLQNCESLLRSIFFLHFYNRAINTSSQIISLGLGSNPFQIFFHTLQISTLLSFSVTLGRYIKHKSHRIPHFEKILLLLTIIPHLILSAILYQLLSLGFLTYLEDNLQEQQHRFLFFY